MLQHLKNMDRRVYNRLNIKQLILGNEIARCYKLNAQQQLAHGLTADERASLTNYHDWLFSLPKKLDGLNGYSGDIISVLLGNATLTSIDRKMVASNGTSRDFLYAMIDMYEDYVSFTWLQHQGKIHFNRTIKSKDTLREVALVSHGKKKIKEIPIMNESVSELLLEIDMKLEGMNAKRA